MAYDFTEISAQGLSVLAAERQRSQVPSGMTSRFVARARSEGIEMSRETASRMPKRNRFAVFAAISTVAAAALIVSFLTFGRPQAFFIRGRPRPRQSSLLGCFRHEFPICPSSRYSPPGAACVGTSRIECLGRQDKGADRRTRVREQSQGHSEFPRCGCRAGECWSSLRQKPSLRARITQLQEELEKSKSEKNAGDVAMALQNTEIRELRKKVADQTEALDQQEGLAAKAGDVRELVVARNLHIIDVHDRDGDGKSQRAFGRIFYTEGKSLIFYAYDLADPRKVDAKVSFYVWGEHLGAEKPIRSLGIFHNDDVSDGRWVLTFDDPHILAQIDSVFVTVESSKKGIREPGGRRILFAFLGDKPNHP